VYLSTLVGQQAAGNVRAGSRVRGEMGPLSDVPSQTRQNSADPQEVADVVVHARARGLVGPPLNSPHRANAGCRNEPARCRNRQIHVTTKSLDHEEPFRLYGAYTP